MPGESIEEVRAAGRVIELRPRLDDRLEKNGVPVRRIGVFCSARPNLDPEIFRQASLFAEGLVQRQWELIYGGSDVGLMGHFASEVLARRGVVRGAVPEVLMSGNEPPHAGLTELVVVEDLFERKRWMNSLSDAFVIFPGGFGTLDEALEVITWKSMGCLEKPIVFVNVNGFWQTQLDAFRDLSERGVIRSGNLNLFEVTDTASGVWSVLDGHFQPVLDRKI